MRKLLLVLGIAVVLLIAAVLIKTALYPLPTPEKQVQAAAKLSLDEEQFTRHLSVAMQFQTVSYQDSVKFQKQPFEEFHAFLETAFPRVHRALKKGLVNHYSLLYTWPGRDTTLKPILLMAHQDVVPVIPGTEQEWQYPPFSGKVADGFIWGRGALDDKSSMIAIFEAVEALLGAGFQPKRTIYLAFGHDEEIGGQHGAVKIAELLQSRGVHFEFVLDEGGVVVQGMIPNLSDPVALIGVTEKGYVSLELTVHGAGGHSSMPPRHTAVGILSQAITKLEAQPFPAHLASFDRFYENIVPRASFLQKLVFANQWLFGAVLKRKLSQAPETNALIRTTTAPTMLRGSVKENVLPIQASAVVNFRILPGDNVANVIDHVTKAIDDPRVQVRSLNSGSNPSPVSDTESRSYAVLQKTIRQVAADDALIVAPYLVLGATDSRHFTGLSDDVYRFVFDKIVPEDLKRVHGTNERIATDNFALAVKFYYQLLKNSEEL